MFPILFPRDFRVRSRSVHIRAHRDRLDGGTKCAAGQVLCNTLTTTGGCRNTVALSSWFADLFFRTDGYDAPRLPRRANQHSESGMPRQNLTAGGVRLATNHAAPAMYRANRPHARQRSVTWQRGGGGKSVGVRSIWPEQDGQLSGDPVRSLAIRWSACAGLNVAGLGLRICYYLATATDPGNHGAGPPRDC